MLFTRYSRRAAISGLVSWQAVRPLAAPGANDNWSGGRIFFRRLSRPAISYRRLIGPAGGLLNSPIALCGLTRAPRGVCSRCTPRGEGNSSGRMPSEPRHHGQAAIEGTPSRATAPGLAAASPGAPAARWFDSRSVYFLSPWPRHRQPGVCPGCGAGGLSEG